MKSAFSFVKTISAVLAMGAATVGSGCGAPAADTGDPGTDPAADESFLSIAQSQIAPAIAPGHAFRPFGAASVVLLSSRQSHAIEVFDLGGSWRRTFASTGARAPFGLSQSPVTGDVYVTTNTDTLLRYSAAGRPLPSGPLVLPPDGNVSISTLFDPTGNLYVATYYGGAAQGISPNSVRIYEYPAATLSQPSPPVGPVITTDLIRGDQMAFDSNRDLCLGSFISETVQCYDPSGAVVHDYGSALLAATGVAGTVEPDGVAFDATGRLFVSSVFLGDVVSETSAYGTMTAFATGLVHDTDFITFDAAQNLYVATFKNGSPRLASCSSYDCQDGDFASDVVYRIAPGGAVTPFITDHAYGPTQIIFGRISGCLE